MFFHSIRWRLQVWHGLILLCVLSGFGVTAYQLQRANELRRVDQELQRRLAPLLEALRRPFPGGPGGPGGPGNPRGPGNPGEHRGPPPPRESPDGRGLPPREFRIGPNRAALFEDENQAFYYVVWDRDGREISRSESAPEYVVRPTRGGVGTLTDTRFTGSQRELFDFTPPGECLLVGRSITPELAALHRLALWLSLLGGGVWLLGLAGGWWLSTRAIRPIEEISATAAKIATGDLSHRINTARTDDELGRLAVVLNSTFARLDAAFTQQAQFTSDASHELRTPLSVILMQTQTALSRERSPEAYRETLEACQRAAQRMRRLIASLLELARLDAGQEPLLQSRFDLGPIAGQALELLAPLAAERGVTVHQELAHAPCRGDADRVAQVVTNVVSNAILQQRSNGHVWVETKREGRFSVVTVADDGPGISSEDLPRIFERFYRADKSRTGTTGGTGLGLAISKAIVEAHGGSIEVASLPGQGATFTVRFLSDADATPAR